MSGQLTGQRAFITGGASGIGAEMARRFTREGASVVIADVNDTLGKAIAVEVGGEYVHLDVTDSTAWEKIITTHKPFDIVCLNAGVATKTDVFGATVDYPFQHLDNDSYQHIMSINVDGVVFGARAVIPGMVERRSGHILVTASLAGIVAIAADPIYGLTKHAMVGLTKSLGAALEPHGVCVSALCPAFLDTPLLSDNTRKNLSLLDLGIMDVSIAGDLAMRALTERVSGSQWIVMDGQSISQYIPAAPFA
ncbi:MAG: SDR family NAD(P)-dependent oxidoreductase [Actinobacteria bacterium]|nr:SDR family NAD(P)-dependent oxidoreductase [Actinomycetota bacterium]